MYPYHNVLIIEAFRKQIVFLAAPTPSLVFLQFSCCYSLLGLPQELLVPLFGPQHKISKNQNRVEPFK